MTLQTGWYSRRGFDGDGLTIFVNADGGTAGTYYVPGAWFGLFNFSWNTLTRAFNFDVARQDEYSVPPVQVGTGSIRLFEDGASAEFTTTIDGATDTGGFVLIMPVGAINPPPFPPPPPPPEPPIEPLPPVVPPGLGLNPVVRTWAQLFGSEFGGSGWRLNPPFVLHNAPSGLCDVLCIAFRAPSLASGFNFGRFTQSPDAGAILQWFSHAPADLSMAQVNPRAWIVGDLAWKLAGTNPTRDRVELVPGEVYYLNAAFVKGELITEGRVIPSGAGGEYALTATQQS